MAESRYNEQNKEVIDELLLAIPVVTAGKAFGYPAYKVNGKVFCFVGGNGVSVKLPEQRVSQLIDSQADFHPFYPAEGILWKGWVSILLDQPDDYRQHIDIFEESVGYVGSGA